MKGNLRFFLGFLSIAATGMIGCVENQQLGPGNGFIEVDGGNIWYDVTGNGGGTPILLLHGGPGYPSYYLKPLTKLGVDRPVIRFDQLGCGRSERISDTTLMTIGHHVEQVRKIVEHLDLKKFYLYGHSWGSMLATEYYLKYPEGIKGLILASPCLDAKRWVRDAETLIATLPDSTASRLRNNIKGVHQDPKKLKTAVDSYLEHFIVRKKPIPAEVDSANAQTGINVYVHMWGENEFFATGSLKDYDRTGELDQINVPTLFTAGEFDEAQPATVKYYQSLTRSATFEMISNAGHLTMQDNPNADLQVLRSFLNKNDIE